MINLSSNYYTVQQGIDWAAIRRAAPTASLYLEMTHCTAVGEHDPKARGDAPLYRRTTPEQFYTTTHLAAARGADGVSLFNFQYYREYGDPRSGPFSEPPFGAMSHLADHTFLATAPQHYFLSPAWRSPYHNPTPLPRTVRAGNTAQFVMEMAPPPQGWQRPARLRIQTEERLGSQSWQVSFNGQVLAASEDISEPYPILSPAMLGTAQTLRAWSIPANLMRAGDNSIAVTLLTGPPAKLGFIDLAVR
jgi:hypothetical protein